MDTGRTHVHPHEHRDDANGRPSGHERRRRPERKTLPRALRAPDFRCRGLNQLRLHLRRLLHAERQLVLLTLRRQPQYRAYHRLTTEPRDTNPPLRRPQSHRTRLGEFSNVSRTAPRGRGTLSRDERVRRIDLRWGVYAYLLKDRTE